MQKVALVTGAGGGIGKAIARRFADKGVSLALVDVSEPALEEATAGILAGARGSIRKYAVDISESDRVQRCVEKIANDFGSVDFLINCAGISRSSLIVDTSVEEWEKVFAINTRSVFLFSRDVAKLMIKNRVSGGRIVIISSQASKIGELGNGAYCASKAALNSLTQVLGLELAKYGIAVSALCPGYVDTEMMQKVFRERGPIEGMTAEQYRDKLLSNVPNGRMVHPDEIAGLVDYLCGEGAAPITGVTITIAGGQTLI